MPWPRACFSTARIVILPTGLSRWMWVWMASPQSPTTSLPSVATSVGASIAFNRLRTPGARLISLRCDVVIDQKQRQNRTLARSG